MQFWPVVGWVNHQYVPLQLRVIFHSVIACAWYNPCFPVFPLPPKHIHLLSNGIFLHFVFHILGEYFWIYKQGRLQQRKPKGTNQRWPISDDQCSPARTTFYVTQDKTIISNKSEVSVWVIYLWLKGLVNFMCV